VTKICSKPEDRDKELDQLKEKFKERNYPEKVIDEKKERRALIFQNRKNKGSGAKNVRLIFTHNEANPPIHKWLRLCKPLLERSAVAKEIGSKIQICTKQPKNLQQILGGYREKQRMFQKAPLDAGCSKCDKKCKVSCPTGCFTMNCTKVFGYFPGYDEFSDLKHLDILTI
jgi:hypothetical protein